MHYHPMNKAQPNEAHTAVSVHRPRATSPPGGPWKCMAVYIDDQCVIAYFFL
jgi:hypothetical protein